jgi:Leucine-rich repeat (LRR) protein
VAGMKQILLMIAVVALVGCGTTKIDPNAPANIADPIVEKRIRTELRKPTGELTEADLEKVTELNLVGYQLTDVKGLEKLTKLKELSLDGNQLTDVKGLEKLTKLKELSLPFNQLTNVKGLEKLTQLKELYLQANQLTDVKGLEKLTNLEGLYLEGNPDLTKAQIDELKKALPKCKIYSNPTK